MLDRSAMVDAAKMLLKISLGTEYYYACATAQGAEDLSHGVTFPVIPVNNIYTGPNTPPDTVFPQYESLKSEIDPIYDAYASVLNRAVGITFPKQSMDVFQSQLSGLFGIKVGLRPVRPTHRACWAEEHQGKLLLNVEFSKDQRESYIVRGYSMPHKHLFGPALLERNVA